MPSPQRQLILSRFFNDNVQLVARMCPRCYEESVDVKILAINLQFLKLSSQNFQDEKALNTIHGILHLESTPNAFLGFRKEEVDESLNYSEKMEMYCDNMAENHKKTDDNNNNNRSFCGFSDKEKSDSKTFYKSFKRLNRSIRYKVYERVSLKPLKSMSSTRSHQSLREEHRKSIRRKEDKGQESKYFTPHMILLENKSSYFSKPNKGTNIKIKGDQEKESKHFKPMNGNGSSDNFFKSSNYLNIKIKKEPGIKCIHDTKEELEGKDFESEYFNLIKTEQQLMLKTEGVKYPITEDKPNLWIPPRSPHNLIEEVLHHDPWALLVATIFLNRTSCMCARPFVFWFLKENPHPLKVLERYPEDLEKYFVKLGLQRTRAVQVWRMSHDFVHKDWKNVKELYGIGKYGEDAFRMFCKGDFSVAPRDRFLRIYKAWYEKVVMYQGDLMGEVVTGSK